MTVRRGPADADRFRVTRYGQRWYRDPLPGCDIAEERSEKELLPAFTTVKKVHDKTFRKRYGDQTYGLDALRCAQYVAEHRDHLLHLDPETIIHSVACSASAALSKAGNRGTGVHAMLEALSLGTAVDRNWLAVYYPDSVDYYDVVMAFWNEQQPEILYEEVVGMNWEVGYACTADALGVRLKATGDKLLAIDYKTRGADSQHGAYDTEAMQLAAAANVEYLFVEDDDGHMMRVVRQRPPAIDHGLIVSIKPDSYELYPTGTAIDSPAWEAWVLTAEAWDRKRRSASLARKAIGDPIFVQHEQPVTDPVAAVKATFPGAVEVHPDDPFAGLPGEDGKPNPDRAKITGWLRERVVTLADMGATLRWPDGVPTFREMADAGNLHSMDELGSIEAAIERAEADARAPFPEPTPETRVAADDPRILALVERVTAMTDAERDAFAEATAHLHPKPSTGQCPESVFAEIEAAAARIGTDTSEWIERAREAQPNVMNEHGIVNIDVLCEVIGGGKREILKAARKIDPKVKNAAEVVKNPALVARIVCEGDAA